ncbi:MAG: hypothetical protein IH623_12580, partial [Verrucomicrobia bacterium]|nr:hypothetical protein [Verrucomicrobiota bacterium]
APPVRQDDEAIARARAAMRQEIQNLDAQQQPAPRRTAPAKPAAPIPPPPVAQPAPPPPVAPTPVVVPPPLAPVYTPPPPQDDAAIARARAALRQELQSPDTRRPAAAPAPSAYEPARVVAQPPRSGASAAFPEPPAPSVAPSFRSPEAPPSPIPAAKELELVELLRKYRADEISPEEYHRQRAAVLARP